MVVVAQHTVSAESRDPSLAFVVRTEVKVSRTLEAWLLAGLLTVTSTSKDTTRVVASERL
jgi:hypothetical protein